jgi:outer membrane protein OmpA-like peptidoglycan-associated protein
VQPPADIPRQGEEYNFPPLAGGIDLPATLSLARRAGGGANKNQNEYSLYHLFLGLHAPLFYSRSRYQVGELMTKDKAKEKPGISLIRKLVLIIIGLFLLYVIVGFWVVPPLLKPKLEKELSSQLGRKVTIEEIKLNPLALSATLTNLAVYEKDGAPFAGFQEFLVNAELSSIVRWALTFKSIELRAPFGVLKILPDRTLNISDILTKFSQTEPAPEEPAELPRALISKLQVNDGKFTIENLTGAEPITETYSPITFILADLSTLVQREGEFKFAGVGPLGGKYQLDGQLSVNPVRVQGSYSTTGTNLSQSWKHIEDQVSFQIKKGTASTSGNYFLEMIDGTLNAKLQNGVFELKDFELSEKGEDKVLISIPSFSVQGISADLAAREVVVEQVNTADARIESWLEPDGTFNLQRLVKPEAQPSEEKKKAASAEPPTSAGNPSEETKDAGKPWYATIHKIEVDDWGAAIEDRTLPEPVRLSVDDLTVRVEDLTSKKDSKAKVALALQLNQAGTLKVNGSTVIDPLSADVEVLTDKLELKSFQPYVGQQVKAQIASGTTSSKGRLLYQGQGGQPQIRYQGELSLDGVEIKSRKQGDNLITLQQFKASGIDLEIHPNKLQVTDALVHNTNANLTVDPKGSVNVVDSFTPVEKEGEKGKDNLIEKFINFLIFQVKGEVPVNIERVRVEDFEVDFSDESIQPTFSTHLVISKASMENLSSDLSARGDFKIAGTIDQSATIGSFGQMNPFNAMQSAQADFSLKDFNLPSVTPYAAKYVGYKIAEGKLNLNLKYRVAEHKFTGDNQIYVVQMALGDPVESEVAHPVLVKMGIALLTGGDGNITLQVPVSGDINDPQIDFGQTVISALTGAVTDLSSSQASAGTESSSIVTGSESSPAAAGTESSAAPMRADIEDIKGEEVRFIEFEFGLAELSEPAMKKLDALAKFLNEKPDVKLGIEGTADRQMDRVKDQAADDKQLTMLALTRANQVKNYLIRKGNIAAGRLSLNSAKILSTTDKENGRVELQLSVQ